MTDIARPLRRSRKRQSDALAKEPLNAAKTDRQKEMSA